MNVDSKRTLGVLPAAIVGVLVALVPGAIWSALLVANLALSPAIPWAVAVMALLLWLLWQYLGGRWGPRATADARHRALRARRVPRDVFSWALLAGMLSIASLAGLWIVLFQLAGLPSRALVNYSAYPFFTVALVLVMASLVSSVPEEAGIRGYFQGALERRVGAVAAILIPALVIAPGHAQTQGFVWPTLVFYLCADIMLGVMAYLTGSIVPGVVVHSLGLLVFFTLVWPGDTIRQLVGAGSANLWYWLHVAQVLIFAALAILAFVRLARHTASLRAVE
ncbi:MAG: CPBP family intramembrane glutamic endopeptidase [Ktedonobacterales bacterium]